MEKQRAKDIVVANIETLSNVQSAIIADERAKEILVKQLKTLQENIFESIDKEPQ